MTWQMVHQQGASEGLLPAAHCSSAGLPHDGSPETEPTVVVGRSPIGARRMPFWPAIRHGLPMRRPMDNGRGAGES